ncbi:anthranilate phosphoribosyltransferase [Methylacidiphilum sp. Yel]|jgi:anthranilate phosphoribosyltransferase|uniref:anthranilate phosphoribosyltransferase n=1 Tax=Methylacidiphilum sp. Yel TaxID=1847730 RepID=UPI0010691299|nr:anthranilate phosphoribosyltransferase [Methylacidiphilum sp. Yel]TFE71022.1 anthranilate phosphoribosyltransferase [Methylacidiphilum sp. Yel]
MKWQLHALSLEINAGRELDEGQVQEAVAWLLNPSIPDSEKEQFLVCMARRGMRPKELVAFARVFLEKSLRLSFQKQWDSLPLFDCCGSGGGGLSLFNVSTAMVFVLASLGVPVIKHGNKGITKISGSADVLEKLGIAYRLSPDGVDRSMREIGFAFVYAPDYHPSFMQLAPLRKKLGEKKIQTVFHFLGPLMNPARPMVQVVGVFREEHVDLFDAALEAMGIEQRAIVYGLDEQSNPLGELGVEGLGKAAGIALEAIRPLLKKHALKKGYACGSMAEALVHSPLESAQKIEAIFRATLKGYARGLVVANCLVGLLQWGWKRKVEDALEAIEEAIDSGKVYRKLQEARHFALVWQRASSSS